MTDQIKLVVFDWEGTLSDTMGQIIHVINHESIKHGFGEIDHEKARKCVHFGLKKALDKLFPDMTKTEFESISHTIQQGLSTRSLDVYLIPGALTFLHQLKQAGIEMAIATNKGEASLTRALEAADITPFFKITRSAGQTAPKPHPEMLQDILNVCQIAPEEALMIGDSVSDIEMAKAAEVKPLGFDYYHQNEAALLASGAEQVYDNYVDIATEIGLNRGDAN